MICKNCEKEFDETKGDCPYCGAVPEGNLQGNNINTTGQPERDYERENQGPRVVYKQFNIGSSIVSWLVLIVIVAVLMFFVLPVFVFIALAAVVVWMLGRIFMGF